VISLGSEILLDCSMKSFSFPRLSYCKCSYSLALTTWLAPLCQEILFSGTRRTLRSHTIAMYLPKVGLGRFFSREGSISCRGTMARSRSTRMFGGSRRHEAGLSAFAQRGPSWKGAVLKIA